MKKIYNKINEFWLKCRQWSNSNILGYLIIGVVKVITITAIGLLLFYALFIIGPFSDKETPQWPPVSDSSDTTKDNCTVAGINIHGLIMDYIPEHAEGDPGFNYDAVGSENILYLIKQANEDPKIKALVLEIDSTGGFPVAGEEISNAVKNSVKPIVGLIRQDGLSAAYWAVSGADKIFASKNSTVGSIGVTQTYLNNVEKNKTDGYTLEQLSSGKFKDSGNPDIALTKEEKDLFMRDVNIVYQNFIEAVSTNRNIPLDEVKKFADGSRVLGEKAKELGMIDEIGGINEVENYLEKKIGEKPEICWQ
ncbi:MAG: signal peptide peptidase SppA [Candidatus Nomurabacteria bacterium]|nr:signal peptide peptidase SppA [Candidatus Nomurabacteria bacterium]